MKRTGLSVLLAVAVMVVAVPSSALAGEYTLHPRGFGEMTYSSWKGGEGLPDSTGDASQALYFQKFTTTATPVAGIAVVNGLEGQTVDSLSGLEWEHRMDGHCGGGAPRWNVNTVDADGNEYTLFLGCAGAVHSPGSDPMWVRDTYDATAIGLQAFLQGVPTDSTITSLLIVFDEGTDQGQGFTYLDNIRVNDKTWTSAADNGN